VIFALPLHKIECASAIFCKQVCDDCARLSLSLQNVANKQSLRESMKDKNALIRVSLPVVLFKEDDVHIAYCPAVNVYGYGKSDSEAKKSFEISLSEFFRYTLNKNTLNSELEALGWKIKHCSKISPPNISTLLSKNNDFKTIFNTKSFKKIDKSVAIPLTA
jgi:hypothetical protein